MSPRAALPSRWRPRAHHVLRPRLRCPYRAVGTYVRELGRQDLPPARRAGRTAGRRRGASARHDPPGALGDVRPDRRCVAGGAVVVPHMSEDAVVTAVGPQDVGISAGGVILACSLHPLGFGFTEPLPSGVIDFSIEVRSQPDAHAEEPVPESAPAWRDGTETLSHAHLAATPPVSERVLVRPSTALETVREGYVAPLLGGGSAVVVLGDDDAALARIAEQERVD